MQYMNDMPGGMFFKQGFYGTGACVYSNPSLV